MNNNDQSGFESEFAGYARLISILEKLSIEMVTPGDINATVNIVKLVSAGLTELFEITQKSNNTAIKKIIVDLESKVVDIQHSLLQSNKQINSLIEENESLKNKIKQLEQENNRKSNLTFENGVYYKENDPAPYCPSCWEGDKIARHLSPLPKELQPLGAYECPSKKCGFIGGGFIGFGQ